MMNNASPPSNLVVGVEDGGFVVSRHRKRQKCPLCAVRMQGAHIVDVRACLITVDGFDATGQLCNMLDGLIFEAVMLGGITFAGFNIVDAKAIHERFSRPVIIFMRKSPDNVAVKKALLKHFSDGLQRWELIESLGSIHSMQWRGRDERIAFEVVGGEPEWAGELLRACAVVSRTPEPVRVASMIAKGLSIREN